MCCPEKLCGNYVWILKWINLHCNWINLISRPQHVVWVIACVCAITHTNHEKGSLCGWWKAHPNIKLRGLLKILNSLSRIYFNWYNRVNFKLILLTLLFKSLFFKTNLNCSYFLLLDIFSIVTQWGFCKYVLSKKIKTDIVNKSAFHNRKLIVIV